MFATNIMILLFHIKVWRKNSHFNPDISKYFWHLLLGYILPYPCFISIIFANRHIFEYTYLHNYINESVVKLSSRLSL